MDISSYSVNSEKTGEAVQMVCKINSIFDEKLVSQTLCQGDINYFMTEAVIKRISALSNLMKNRIFLTLGEVSCKDDESENVTGIVYLYQLLSIYIIWKSQSECHSKNLLEIELPIPDNIKKYQN